MWFAVEDGDVGGTQLQLLFAVHVAAAAASVVGHEWQPPVSVLNPRIAP